MWLLSTPWDRASPRPVPLVFVPLDDPSKIVNNEIHVFNCAGCGVEVETAARPTELGYRCDWCKDEPIIGDASKGKHVKRCCWCGRLFWAQRSTARFCTPSHRVESARAEKKSGSEG